MTDPLRVGVAGFGNVARHFHVPAHQSLHNRFEIVAHADLTSDRLDAEPVASGLGAARVHSEAQARHRRHDADLVDPCTPQHRHRDPIVGATRAGRRTACEKPQAADQANAAAAVDAVERTTMHPGVVHNYLSFPESVTAGRLIDPSAGWVAPTQASAVLGGAP